MSTRIFTLDGLARPHLKFYHLERQSIDDLVIGGKWVLNFATGSQRALVECATIAVARTTSGFTMRLTDPDGTEVDIAPLSPNGISPHTLWLEGDGQLFKYFVFARTDGRGPNGRPCRRLHIQAFVLGEQDPHQPSHLTYRASSVDTLEARERACSRGASIKTLSKRPDQDEEGDAYHED